jgi:hypothetical protein
VWGVVMRHFGNERGLVIAKVSVRHYVHRNVPHRPGMESGGGQRLRQVHGVRVGGSGAIRLDSHRAGTAGLCGGSRSSRWWTSSMRSASDGVG